MVEMPSVVLVSWRSVGAHGLHVARLLALVAHALLSGLGGAVARHVADLAACDQISLDIRRIEILGSQL